MLQNLRRDAWYLGHLVGIPIFIHWTALWLAYSAWRWAGGGQAGVDGFIVVLIVLISSILLHELGHGLMARKLGAFGLTITLWAFGGLCESRRDSVRLGREIAIVAAGPAVSLGLWLGCDAILHWLAIHQLPLVVAADGLTVLGRFLATMVQMNLMLLIFNMLPIFPLDGGQLTFYACLAITRNQLLARQISLVLAVLGAVFVFMWCTGFFTGLGSPDPVTLWLQRLQADPLDTLPLIILLALMLRSAFLHLR